MKVVSEGSRNYALDFLKAIAAIFITNSHFIPVYKDVNVGLATLGVHGNALFFFVAGYLLMMGFTKRNERFANWFKKRVQRLWPAVFLWYVAAAIVWGDSLTWSRILLASDDKYWFIQCIVVFYALYYFVGKVIQKHHSMIGIVFSASLLVSVLYAFSLPKAEGSLFHTSWHFVCHFSVMVLGGWVYLLKDKVELKNLRLDMLWLAVSFITYFAILSLGKGKTDWTYYTQILGLIPLHAFCWYAYKVCSYEWCAILFRHKLWRFPFIFLSSLTLEIYIVQFHVITDRFNALFPFSWLIVFSLVCVTAYLLHVMVGVFLQFLRKDEWNRRSVFKI